MRDLLTALLVPLLLDFPDLKLFSQLRVRLGGAVSVLNSAVCRDTTPVLVVQPVRAGKLDETSVVQCWVSRAH